jgi:hypothetical protein
MVSGRGSAYDYRYRKLRQKLLAQPQSCYLRLVCNGQLADTADHDPPLTLHDHVAGSGCCVLIPACSDCQHEQGRLLAQLKRNRNCDPAHDYRDTRPLPQPSRSW